MVTCVISLAIAPPDRYVCLKDPKKAYRWVEKSARNTIKSPDIHSQREAKRQGRKQQRRWIGIRARWWHGRVGDLSTSKGPEEEEESADKLSYHGDHVVTAIVREVEHRKLPGLAAG